MPRLLIKTTGIFKGDAHAYRAATAIEAGGLSYAMMTDMFRTGQSPIMRAVMASVIWFGYSEFVDSMP